jgi:hypothetical protein
MKRILGLLRCLSCKIREGKKRKKNYNETQGRKMGRKNLEERKSYFDIKY